MVGALNGGSFRQPHSHPSARLTMGEHAFAQRNRGVREAASQVVERSALTQGAASVEGRL
eukprot:4157962-Alexandrium_andersonii.AAC.1